MIIALSAAAIVAGCKSPDKQPTGEEPIGSTFQRAMVGRSGDGFSYKGGPFKFIGVNLRGIAYHSNGEIDSQLQSAWSMGARVVRVFIANNKKTHDEVAAALRTLLDRALLISPDLKVMVSLTDFYGAILYGTGARLHVRGDDMYYSNGKLDPSWFSVPSGYEDNYKPLVERLVTEFKSDERIFAWELGNELSNQPGGPGIGGGQTGMFNFAYTMGWNIRNWGAQQMVTTGFENVNHAINGYVTPAIITQLYEGPWAGWSSSPFDFGSIHVYNNQQVAGSPASYDIEWFRGHGYPYVVGEGGFSGGNTSTCGGPIFNGGTWEGVAIPDGTSDRGPAVSATLDIFFDQKGADGYMQWSFVAGGMDIGEGDGCSGMDTYSHGDWNSLFAVYGGKAATLPAGGSSPGGTAGCDNGVPIGGTACLVQGDWVQYVCLAGSTPGNSMWSAQSCNGGTCQGSACTSTGPAGCDNGVPIGGTACQTQGDTVEYVCLPGSTPGNSMWSPQSCNGGTCQGSACTGGGGSGGGSGTSSSSAASSSSSAASSGSGTPGCAPTGTCGCKNGVNNFCLYGINVPGCPMTAPGGYCDPTSPYGDFSDADWTRGYDEYQAACSGSCTGPSCGQLAAINGWSSAKCEWSGNGACGGWGTPTHDCDFCCP
jgi:hypothetical protein